MLYKSSGSRPHSSARQEPPLAVARRTHLRVQSPDPFGATLSPGEGIYTPHLRRGELTVDIIRLGYYNILV